MEEVKAKTIIQRTKDTSWFGVSYNMNIYRGCSHGCIYCDSRSDCYRNNEFEKVKIKQNALEIIRDELRRKVKKGVIGTGAMSDPYNPFEKELLLTKHSFELISAYNFGACLYTKSSLLERDIDIFKEIKENAPFIANITITTTDDVLGKIIEPNVSSSSERFSSLNRLSENGIFSGILFMPMLPFINDTRENVISMVNLASEVGARFIYAYFGVSMRAGQREYFYKCLDEKFPNLKEKYIKKYGNNYNCNVPNYKSLYKLLASECEKKGILYDMKDIIKAYKAGYDYTQMTLF